MFPSCSFRSCFFFRFDSFFLNQYRYLHTNLLERAAQLGKDKHGGGSMTAIAIVDTPHSDSHHAAQFGADETYQLGQRTGTTVSSPMSVF